ncbi:MAG: 2'-5' RNA ligase family protein [Mycobacteriales bacterium]
MSGLSALYLPVPGAEVLLDAVRGIEGVRLLEPAHVSLGYPWVADAAERLDEVKAAAAAVQPAEVELVGPELFTQDARRRVVVHALLSDDAVPRELADRLDAPLRTAHLSVARLRHHTDPAPVLEAVSALLPLAVRLEELELTARGPHGWASLLRVPLG